MNRSESSRGSSMHEQQAVIEPCLSSDEAILAETELQPAPAGTFTVVAIPDTQALAEHWPEHLEDMTGWIADSVADQRIVFCSHLGDMVQHHDSRRQWMAARRAMDRLHGHVPYGISFGNHELKGSGRELAREFLPSARYQGMPWYGGSHNETNTFQLVCAEGMDFLFLHLDCNPTDEALEWANRVMTEHASRRLVVTTHHYLGRLKRDVKGWDVPSGRMGWSRFSEGNTPQQIWEKCLCRHRNLFLVLCGDQAYTQAMRQESVGIHGNVVHEIESDYTWACRDVPPKGSPKRKNALSSEGRLRLLRFVPTDNTIEVRTYSPLTRKLCKGTPGAPEPERHCYAFTHHISNNPRKAETR